MLSVKHILLYFHIFTCYQSNIYCYTFTFFTCYQSNIYCILSHFLHVISQTYIVILSHFLHVISQTYIVIFLKTYCVVLLTKSIHVITQTYIVILSHCYMLSVKHIVLYFHIFTCHQSNIYCYTLTFFTCYQSNIYCYTFTFLHVFSQTYIVILSHFYMLSVKHLLLYFHIFTRHQSNNIIIQQHAI